MSEGRADHPEWPRYRLSVALAERWQWRNDASQLKDMAARTLLSKLATRGLIDLPPPLWSTARKLPRPPPAALEPPQLSGFKCPNRQNRNVLLPRMAKIQNGLKAASTSAYRTSRLRGRQYQHFQCRWSVGRTIHPLRRPAEILRLREGDVGHKGLRVAVDKREP